MQTNVAVAETALELILALAVMESLKMEKIVM